MKPLRTPSKPFIHHSPWFFPNEGTSRHSSQRIQRRIVRNNPRIAVETVKGALGTVASVALVIGLLGGQSAPVWAQAKPDLRISAIATPGGLCAGNENKVRVNVQNSSQLAGVRQKIPVILFVSQPPGQPTSYVGHLEQGIGPQSNQPVWFHNVVVPNTGGATLKAVVNPDQEIEESNYTNNDRIQQVRVANVCGQASSPPPGHRAAA